MIRRFSINFAVFSMFLDAGFTLLALILAVLLRPHLPNFPYLVPVETITLSETLYVIVPTLWVFSFLLTSVYDPQRNYRVTEEFQALLFGIMVATLLFAGVLYLGFRNFSRWLLVTFVLFDSLFVFTWRISARMLLRMRPIEVTEKRVIIIGAGQVGRRVAEMISEFSWSGLNLVGFLDDDPQHERSDINVLGTLDDALDVINQHGVEDVIVALPQRAYGRINRPDPANPKPPRQYSHCSRLFQPCALPRLG
jgi:FlaA1/EpsC-like NDP-sugar epimerase